MSNISSSQNKSKDQLSAHAEIITQVLGHLDQLEAVSNAFFSGVENTFEQPYEPVEAIQTYSNMRSHLDKIEESINSIGIDSLDITENETPENLLKACSKSSTESFNSTAVVTSRSKIALAALSSEPERN